MIFQKLSHKIKKQENLLSLSILTSVQSPDNAVSGHW